MQKPMQQALLRHCLLEQWRQKHRQARPLQARALTLALPPSLQPQSSQSEPLNAHHHTILVHEQSHASRTCLGSSGRAGAVHGMLTPCGHQAHRHR